MSESAHTPAPRVLVVEDSEEYQLLIEAALDGKGLNVEIVGTGERAVEHMRERGADVVLLDVALPGIDGLEVCRQVRGMTTGSIIMLTSRADEIDRVLGLEAGADDYVVKPFYARELHARVRAALRRAQRTDPHVPEVESVRSFSDLVVDVGRREVQVDGAPIELTRIEFDLLDALTASAKQVLSRAQLITHVWGPTWYGDEHVVDVHISNLRRKLGDNSRSPRYIQTVRGYGFRLVQHET